MLETETFNLNLPITTRAREYAKEFAAQQSTAAKRTRVYLNTLAVYAVHEFLKMTDIETDLESSDSWHPVMREFHDVADLVIPNLGTLECRPVLPSQTEIILPPEVIEERIGYVFLRFDDSLMEAELLGFLPMVDPDDPPEEIEVNELQPLEGLFDYLERLEEANRLWSRGEDEVFVRVYGRLEAESRADIIAKLEWIFRNKDDFEWRSAAVELLGSYMGEAREYAVGYKGSSRESVGGDGDVEFGDFAESLMRKLAEIWQK